MEASAAERRLFDIFDEDITNTREVENILKNNPGMVRGYMVEHDIFSWVINALMGNEPLFFTYIRIFKKYGLTLETKIYNGENIIQYVESYRKRDDTYYVNIRELRNIFIKQLPMAGF